MRAWDPLYLPAILLAPSKVWPRSILNCKLYRTRMSSIMLLSYCADVPFVMLNKPRNTFQDTMSYCSHSALQYSLVRSKLFRLSHQQLLKTFLCPVCQYKYHAECHWLPAVTTHFEFTNLYNLYNSASSST